MPVRFERSGHVATIVLDRPEKLNAIDAEMYREIGRCLREVDDDDGIRAAIVAGTGERAFSAGADILEHGDPGDQPAWSPLRPENYDRGLLVRKPLIAAVTGYCLGAGLELALACDIRIAAANASFGAPEVRWGLLHNFGAHRLPRLVGRGDAMHMLLTGEPIDASRAERIGLVQEVVPGDPLVRARELAELVCANAPMAVRATKELVVRADELSVAEGVAYAAALARLLDASDDSQEGVRAFAEKRAPNFTGR